MRKKTPMHYSILTENKPGALSRLTRLLTEKGLTISGMMIASVGDKTAIQFLAPENSALRGVCCSSGITLRATRIFERKAPERPAELYHMMKAFHKQGINILSLSRIAAGAGSRMVLTREVGVPSALT